MDNHATVKVKQESIVMKEFALVKIEMTFEQDEAHQVIRENIDSVTLLVMIKPRLRGCT